MPRPTVSQDLCRGCLFGTCFSSEYALSPDGAIEDPPNFEDWEQAEPEMVQSEYVACSNPKIAGKDDVILFSFKVAKCQGYVKKNAPPPPTK